VIKKGDLFWKPQAGSQGFVKSENRNETRGVKKAIEVQNIFHKRMGGIIGAETVIRSLRVSWHFLVGFLFEN
jgi:hypothetical protein